MEAVYFRGARCVILGLKGAAGWSAGHARSERTRKYGRYGFDCSTYAMSMPLSFTFLTAMVKGDIAGKESHYGLSRAGNAQAVMLTTPCSTAHARAPMRTRCAFLARIGMRTGGDNSSGARRELFRRRRRRHTTRRAWPTPSVAGKRRGDATERPQGISTVSGFRGLGGQYSFCGARLPLLTLTRSNRFLKRIRSMKVDIAVVAKLVSLGLIVGACSANAQGAQPGSAGDGGGVQCGRLRPGRRRERHHRRRWTLLLRRDALRWRCRRNMDGPVGLDLNCACIPVASSSGSLGAKLHPTTPVTGFPLKVQGPGLPTPTGPTWMERRRQATCSFPWHLPVSSFLRPP